MAEKQPRPELTRLNRAPPTASVSARRVTQALRSAAGTAPVAQPQLTAPSHQPAHPPVARVDARPKDPPVSCSTNATVEFPSQCARLEKAPREEVAGLVVLEALRGCRVITDVCADGCDSANEFMRAASPEHGSLTTLHGVHNGSRLCQLLLMTPTSS